MVAAVDWLDQGLLVLADTGPPGLRIDRLAVRLGLSKGSFYHHFTGMAGYRRDLIEHYARRYTDDLIRAAAAEAGPDPNRRREALLEQILLMSEAERRLHVAVRSWAAQDDDVAGMVAAMDRRRLAHLEELFVARRDPAAVLRAQQIYLLLIGARHLQPPLGPTEIEALFRFTLDAVPTGVSA